MKKAAGIVGIIGAFLLLKGVIFKLTHKASAIAIIGGADGPTSVFIAGKCGSHAAVSLIVLGILLLLAAVWIFRKK